MLTKKQAEEILRTLTALPFEKVAEVRDFVRFLKGHSKRERTLDESNVWTDEDLHDLTAVVLKHGDQTG